MKKLVLKINSQEEAYFCSQILNKLGIKLFYDEYYKEGDKEYLYLNTSFGHHLFTYDYIIKPKNKDNYIFVNSWREFVINYLSNYYYKCESKQEKEQIINDIYLNDLNKRENFLQPISVDYCYCEVWYDNNMVFQLGRPENKQKISLDNLLLLINSVRQFEELSHSKNNKNNKSMKQLKINSAAEKFVSRDELNKYIKTSIVNVVGKKGNKYAYTLKLGGLKEYTVLQVNTDYVNGHCYYDSLFEYYDVYLFGTNRNIKLTNVNNDSVEDEFIDAVKSKKQIVIAKERNKDVSYIIEADKKLDDVYMLKNLDGDIEQRSYIEWIFENLDVFVLDI